MKAAMDRKEEFYDPARKDNILGRNYKRDWSCGLSTSKTPGQSPEVRGRSVLKVSAQALGKDAFSNC